MCFQYTDTWRHVVWFMQTPECLKYSTFDLTFSEKLSWFELNPPLNIKIKNILCLNKWLESSWLWLGEYEICRGKESVFSDMRLLGEMVSYYCGYMISGGKGSSFASWIMFGGRVVVLLHDLCSKRVLICRSDNISKKGLIFMWLHD